MSLTILSIPHKYSELINEPTKTKARLHKEPTYLIHSLPHKYSKPNEKPAQALFGWHNWPTYFMHNETTNNFDNLNVFQRSIDECKVKV